MWEYLQSQTVVTAYFSSNQLLAFCFDWQVRPEVPQEHHHRLQHCLPPTLLPAARILEPFSARYPLLHYPPPPHCVTTSQSSASVAITINIWWRWSMEVSEGGAAQKWDVKWRHLHLQEDTTSPAARLQARQQQAISSQAFTATVEVDLLTLIYTPHSPGRLLVYFISITKCPNYFLFVVSVNPHCQRPVTFPHGTRVCSHTTLALV